MGTQFYVQTSSGVPNSRAIFGSPVSYAGTYSLFREN